MFSEASIAEVMSLPLFKADVRLASESLSKARIFHGDLFAGDAFARLGYFVEAVLASAPNWNNGNSKGICRAAAEIAETLATNDASASSQSKNFRLRAALLYELAEYPAIAQAILQSGDVAEPLLEWFNRSGRFGALSEPVHTERTPITPSAGESLADLIVASDVFEFSDYVQGRTGAISTSATSLLEKIAKDVSLGLSATELKAYRKVFQVRSETATRAFLDESLFRSLAQIHFPPELWPAQSEAIKGGLLDETITSWGLAAPTGTGKTFLARLLILRTLREHPSSKVLYIVPSRALVYEISSKLADIFDPLGLQVAAVTPQLVSLDDEESSRLTETSVLVLTPEKADMLLRLGDAVFDDVSLVVIDEAHHIESGTRGILLEMYLWRLKTLLRGTPRYVFLSAVAPNIKDIASWMSSSSKGVVVRQRPTRMRAGVFRIIRDGKTEKGIIQYTDETVLTAIPGKLEATAQLQLVQLAHAVGVAGPVLIVINGKATCENFAKLMAGFVERHGNPVPLKHPDEELLGRLDSRLERELYEEVLMRKLMEHRVAYHHAGLPPRVRMALEDAIRKNQIGFVFATTTLAEGVNFPFSTVIVQSVATREMDFTPGRPAHYSPMTPRVFWNIAGRAGRPGFDKEGQVILFEPTLGIDKIEYVLSDYLNSELNASTPVESALSAALKSISAAIHAKEIDPNELSKPVLSEAVPKKIQGAVNLVRVSLIHARASKIGRSPEEIVDSTFAARFLDKNASESARILFKDQEKVISDFLLSETAISERLAAELGLSIQTLIELRDWVQSLEPWKLGYFETNLFFGGVLNLSQVPYVVGPVAKRMSELEGARLGGIYSDVIVKWVSGVPFTAMKDNLNKLKQSRIEDLVSLMFSRIQYLLPWGLYAADRFVEAEAKSRRMEYNNTIATLAYLADAGVPSLDALQLTRIDIERTDASRLASAYRMRGGLNQGVDITAWVANQTFDDLRRIIAGPDRRKLDYDFEEKYEELRASLNL